MAGRRYPRALGMIGAVLAVVAVACAVPAPPPGPSGPPGTGFPNLGCYEARNMTFFPGQFYLSVIGPVDTLENALFGFSEPTCAVPPGADLEALQRTIVHAESGGAAIAKCNTLEPGTIFPWDSTVLLISGTPDYFMCDGGLSPGDCVTSNVPGKQDIRYEGPIDTLDNAEYHTEPVFPNPSCASLTGHTTVVVASTQAVADGKCQGLSAAFAGAINLYTDGYLAPVGGIFGPGTRYRCIP